MTDTLRYVGGRLPGGMASVPHRHPSTHARPGQRPVSGRLSVCVPGARRHGRTV